MVHTPTTNDAAGAPNPWTLASMPRRADDLPELCTRGELATFLGVSIPTLARWATTGEGPRVTKIGAHVRYRRSHVLAYLDESAA